MLTLRQMSEELDGLASWADLLADLRDRVLGVEGLTARQAAEPFGVSVLYVVKARQRLARAGAATPRPQKPATARKLVPFHEALQARVAGAPDATLASTASGLPGRTGSSRG